MGEIMNMKRFLLAILGIQVVMFAYLEMCRIANVIVIQAHLQHVQFFMQAPWNNTNPNLIIFRLV